MSLDVYLYLDYGELPIAESSKKIPIREDGSIKLITREGWDRRHPDRVPLVPVSIGEPEAAYWANITHNLGKMASEAGIYEYLWRPDEIGVATAWELIQPLRKGLKKLVENRKHFEQFNPANGWGDYDGL